MKPSIPKGTRDFSPAEMLKREYLFSVIREQFRLYGYQPLETPAMENLSTLTGKYGDEGDQLIFKILNSGNYLNGISDELLKDAKKLTPGIAEKALRYDLTVPFARYVVMNQHQITFPFRRYQVQPVWRADRPQKGRYREFYQCDADIIGSDSLVGEAELIEMVIAVFNKFKLGIKVKLNNRKILAGITEIIGAEGKMIEVTVALDKLDKIGIEKVNDELLSRGISKDSIDKLYPVIQFKGSDAEKLSMLDKFLENSETGKEGIREIRNVFNLLEASGTGSSVCELDLTLARGLNYYTGAIIEVKADDERTDFSGSICGGGRYDDLTGIFGLKGLSGVGISFGADRIYDVLEDSKLFPDMTLTHTRLLVLNFGEEELEYAATIVRHARNAGISTELYPDAAKIKKQMGYADALKIPFVALAGSEEKNAGEVTLKNMGSGSQEKISLQELSHKILN